MNAAGQQLRTSVVSASGDAGALAAWSNMFAARPDATAYLCPEWMAAWVSEFAPSLRPSCVEVLNGERVVGTCLLTVRTVRRGPVAIRRVHINTDGEEPGDRVVVEHNALLSTPGCEAAVCAAVAAHVRTLEVDELVFSGALEPEVYRLCAALPEWRADVEWRDAPYVDLARLREEGREHLRSLSRNTREQLTRALRRYQRQGPLRLEFAHDGDSGVEYLTQLITLHERHWHARGERGGFATAHRRDFHERFIRAGVPAGRAQLLRVWCGERLLGVVYYLVANGHVAFYQSGFHYEEDPHRKPGLVVHHLAISHFLEAGYREYDFLPSGPGEGRYKVSLANASRRLGTLMLARPGWRRRGFDLLRALRQASAQHRPA